MLTPTDSIIILCIIAALVALGTVIALSNERVRRATLQVRDVTRDYALADLAMRRESARRSISFSSPVDALSSLTQIALDVSGKRYDLAQLSATKDTTAIVARTRDLYDLVFAPNDKAYFASHLSARSRKPHGRWAATTTSSMRSASTHARSADPPRAFRHASQSSSNQP
mgnify:CR=1 FL=1